jgi:hypothetical protein
LGKIFKTNLKFSSSRPDFFNFGCAVEQHHFKMQHHLTVQNSLSSLFKPSQLKVVIFLLKFEHFPILRLQFSEINYN